MRYILYILFGAVVADGILSNFLIVQGLGWEWNPFLRGIVGGDELLLLKACGVVLAMVLLWNIYRRHPLLAAAGGICALSLYAAIIYWNLFSFALAAQAAAIAG
jgi:hypothetical protein